MQIPFEAVDVANDPGGMERLRALGLRSVPVLARGDQYVFAVDLDAVARFVGLKDTGHTTLPPDVLVRRLVEILRTAQAIVRQIPDDKLTQDAVHNRKRDLRLLSHHVFRIGEAYLEVAIDGVPFARGLGEKPLAEGEFRTGEDIARYGDGVIKRLETWWDELDDKTCGRSTEAYFGTTTLHMRLERSTGHPAQHTRQLSAVLEGFGITLDKALTPEMLAGLPLPERLWE